MEVRLQKRLHRIRGGGDQVGSTIKEMQRIFLFCKNPFFVTKTLPSPYMLIDYLNGDLFSVS